MTAAAVAERPCNRRETSVWTKCTCPSCVVANRRVGKLRRGGVLAPTPSERAHRVLRWMLDRGWTPTAIASATGMPLPAVHSLVSPRAADRTIGRVRARQLVNHGWPTQGHIGATGAARRLRALAVMGWPAGEVAARAGVAETSVRAIRIGERATIPVGVHDAIAAVYDALSMTAGPSKRSTSIALRRHGWAPPLAWDDDDIDDPAATPRGRVRGDDVVDDLAVARACGAGAAVPARLRTIDRHEAVRRLTERGWSLEVIAAQLGVTPRTIHRDREHLGLVTGGAR